MMELGCGCYRDGSWCWFAEAVWMIGIKLKFGDEDVDFRGVNV